MEYRALKYRKDGFVGIITLSRPHHGNAISSQMASEIREIAEQINWRSDVRVILLTGEGQSVFCAGTDESELDVFDTREELIARLSVASTVSGLDRPVIAAINGDAAGQGLELALACDLRLSSETARFSMPQPSLGDLPWDGGTQRLPRLIGRARAMAMMLLGETMDAQQALAAGLVNRVVPQDQLQAEALEIARDLASKAPVAMRYAKEAVIKGMDMTLEQGLRLEADLYFLIHTTEDRTEGITAFRERRSPSFNGK